MLFKRYLEILTLYTHPLCLLQCVSAPRANICSRCHIIVDFLQENAISVFYFRLSRLIQCLCCFLVTRINIPIKLPKIYIETVSAQDIGFSTKSYVKIKY